jgi:hypothetical protein
MNTALSPSDGERAGVRGRPSVVHPTDSSVNRARKASHDGLESTQAFECWQALCAWLTTRREWAGITAGLRHKRAQSWFIATSTIRN